MVLVTYGNTGVSDSLSFKWILLPVHNDVNTALCASCVGMASLWYGQGRGDECPSRPAVHGPPPRPDLTDFWNNRRQESVPFVSKVHPRRPVTAVRPRPAPTARSDELLQQSAPGICAVCFKSPSRRPVTDGRPRPAPTARSDGLLQQSAPGICAVCFKSPSRRPVTAGRPRPAATARSDELLQQSAPGIRAVCFKSPSRRPVTAVRPRPETTGRSGGLLQQSAWGICAVCFKSPSQRPVTDVRHGPLWRTSETNGAPYVRDLRAMNALATFKNDPWKITDARVLMAIFNVRSWKMRKKISPKHFWLGDLATQAFQVYKFIYMEPCSEMVHQSSALLYLLAIIAVYRTRQQQVTSTVYWCIASKLKAPRNFYWMSNMFL